jgi:hypothetical protein
MMVAVAATFAGQIFGVRLQQSPNDAARWNTIWSLAEHNTYQIFDTEKEAQRFGVGVQYGTIDKVQRITADVVQPLDADGKPVDDPSKQVVPRFYSSKPPLFPTAVSFLVKAIRPFGPPIVKDDPGKPTVGTAHMYFKPTLMIVNVVPLIGFLMLFARYLQREAETDFSWLVCLVIASFGTMMSGYMTTLNNHVMAATSAGLALLLLLPTWYEGRWNPWRLLLGGTMVAWTAANELPAAGFVILALLLTLRRTLIGTLLFFLPPVILIGCAFFYTNYQTFGSYVPAYLQKELYDYEDSYWRAPEKMSAIDALSTPDAKGNYREGPRVPVEALTKIKQSLAPSKDSDKPVALFLSRDYLLHMTVGHHGVFSMTPIWLFSIWGVLVLLYRGTGWERLVALAWIALTLTVFFFYCCVNTERNYGGFCQGMRWLIWLTPFWLLYLPRGINAVAQSRFGRGLVLFCSFVSIFSAACAWQNPWTYSWIHRVLIWIGVVTY